MLNHVHKTTVNALSDSLSLSLLQGLLCFPSVVATSTNTLLHTQAFWQSLSFFQSIAPYCTNTAIPPRELSGGDLKGFVGVRQKLTHGQLCVCGRALIKARGEQPSGGGCRMWAVIIEEGVGLWGPHYSSTAKNKHLLISSPPPPSPNHCLLRTH